MKRNGTRLLLLHAAVLAGVAAYVFIIVHFRIYCPVKYITGLPCPGCGSTRAVFALLRGDFSAYMSYNPFAVPLLLAMLAAAHTGLFGRRRAAVLVPVCAVALGAFLYNLTRLGLF